MELLILNLEVHVSNVSYVRKSHAVFEDCHASSSFVLLRVLLHTVILTVFKYYVELTYPNHNLNLYSPYHSEWIANPQIPSSSTYSNLI